MSVLISTGDVGERLDGLLSDKDVSSDDKVKGINLILQPLFEGETTRFTAERAVAKLNQKHKGQYTIIAMEAKEAFVTPFDPFQKYHTMFGLQIANSALDEDTK